MEKTTKPTKRNQKFWLRYCFDTEDLLICSFIRRKQYIFYDVCELRAYIYLLLNGNNQTDEKDWMNISSNGNFIFFLCKYKIMTKQFVCDDPSWAYCCDLIFPVTHRSYDEHFADKKIFRICLKHSFTSERRVRYPIISQ